MGIDYALVPPLYSGSTLLAGAALLILVFVAKKPPAVPQALPRLLSARLVAFATMHAALVWLAGSFAADLSYVAREYSLGATAVVSLKVLPLVPSLFLFPLGTWRRLVRRYVPELVAALIVLLTFFPFRFMGVVWPAYSNLLADLIYQSLVHFVPGLYYIPGPQPVVVGSQLALQIVFECSGISGIYLFDALFALFVVLEWNRLNKLRVLACYAIGLAAVLLANFLRLILLVLVGNLISAKPIERGLHRHAGWVLFALAFFVFLQLTYRWMHAGPPSAPAADPKG